jgi:GNAT superfamily N-acetyltransferase
MDSIKIRKAKKKDLPEILGLVKELAFYEKEPEEVTCQLSEYESSFEEGNFCCLVAELEGNILGMALYFYVFSTWKGKMMYLEDFVVSPELRGKGVGKRIFDFLLIEAKTNNCKLIKWQVLDWNVQAQNFYKKYNADIEKQWWNGKIFLTNS